MKTKAVVLCCLIGTIVLFAGYEYSLAKPKTDKAVANIGVVDIRKVFRDCKRNAKYGADAMAEEAKWNADVERRSKEIDLQKEGLKALKLGSSDYLAQVKEVLQKQADLEASRQFNSQQRTSKDQRWTEDLYVEILKIIGELAEQKQLDLVLQKDVADFPTASPDELMMTLSTHKLLYSGGCMDITAEVLAQVDAEKKQ
jgi:Skp family chaperone for outer membrane proteins